MNSGKLITIDGLDGNGKQTQTELLYNRLIYDGYDVKKITFPNYNSDSSALVKMYLNGEFGDSADSVNAYTASTFYAVDRFASYKKEWEEFYKSGGIVLTDRYVSSNMIYQASKIEDINDKEKFLNWLWDLEYIKMKLPLPYKTIFLDVPIEYSQKLIQNRKNKINDSETKDIHEKDIKYLTKTYSNSHYIVNKYNFNVVNCVKNEELRSIEDINDSIYRIITEL